MPPPKSQSRAWFLLCAHTICCIALSLVLLFVINGYEAIDTSTPRYSDGKLLLRVSDITTLVSVALVIIKFFVSCWAAFAVWKCAFVLTYSVKPVIDIRRLSFMTRYKLPPWIRHRFELPKGHQSWIMAAALPFIFLQSFISPILSGAVDWNPSSVLAGKAVQVNFTGPSADFSEWGWYLGQDVTRKEFLRRAAGFAALAWSSTTTVSTNGTSITGNGCRHVVNDDGLPAGSTVANATIPCIDIHSISWATSPASPNMTSLVLDPSPLTIVGDNPYYYFDFGGKGYVFDPNNLWDSRQAANVLPNATLFSRSMYAGLQIARQTGGRLPACKNLAPTIFGNASSIKQWLFDIDDTDANCYIVGNISFTAGVTTSRVSTYLSSRVVEDQTPLDQVVFEPSAWVQESLWLLPDLMTMVATTNSSQLPTWDNIDIYFEALVRQCYLAAWAMYKASFDMESLVYNAIAVEPRIQASVAFGRVLSWLAICLLMTLGGVCLLRLNGDFIEVSQEPDQAIQETVNWPSKGPNEVIEEAAKDEAKGVMEDLQSAGFFDFF
jgi:hypothetical protein